LRNIAFIPAVTAIHSVPYFLLLPSKESTKENSPLYKKSLFSFIPLSFASPKERGKEKGFCDPKEISPFANRGCRQHGCTGQPFVSVTAISADRTLKPMAVTMSGG
jgi:hypothetical protein